MNATGQKQLLKALICLMLAGITFAAFADVGRCSFMAMDDWVYVVGNSAINHGFSWSAIQWALKSVYASYWIPITWLSHILDCQLYGLNPVGHHITNLIFHIVDTVLLFLLLQKLTARLWPSAFVALLFGIHPMHVESVAWIAERKDVLSAFFFLLTLLAYARYAELALRRADLQGSAIVSRPPVRKLRKASVPTPLPVQTGREGAHGPVTANSQSPWIAYGLALLFFILGLMSKPMLVTVPFVLLLLDFWPLKRFSHSAIRIRQSAIDKIPFFLLSAFFSYVTVLAGKSAGAIKLSTEFSLADRLGHIPVSFIWYISKFGWPSNLSVLYIWHKGTIVDWEIVLASLLLLGITAFALFRVRANPYLIVGWLWFLGTLVPVIGIVQAGDQAYADRFAYLPYIGLSIMIAWGVPDLLAHLCRTSKKSAAHGSIPHPAAPKRSEGGFSILHPPSSVLLCTGALAIGVACFWRTDVEIGYWKDGATLLNRAVTLDPQNEMAWGALGFEYEVQTNNEKALYCARRSISANSRFAPSWNFLGGLLANEKDYTSAEDAYQTALSLTWLKSDRIYIFKRLGDAFEDDQKYSQAAAAYQSSLTLDARQADAQTKLGQSLMHANQPDAAAAAFQTAISLQPTNSDAYLCLGMISQGTGFDSDAIAQYRNALQADPNSIPALNNLAWIMATDSDPALRNGPEAVSLAESACQLTHYQHAVYIGTLAAAYAEAGRFDDAVTSAQRAHDVALAHGDNQHAARNAQLLQIYKSHQAYHSASSKN